MVPETRSSDAPEAHSSGTRRRLDSISTMDASLQLPLLSFFSYIALLASSISIAAFRASLFVASSVSLSSTASTSPLLSRPFYDGSFVLLAPLCSHLSFQQVTFETRIKILSPGRCLTVMPDSINLNSSGPCSIAGNDLEGALILADFKKTIFKKLSISPSMVSKLRPHAVIFVIRCISHLFLHQRRAKVCVLSGRYGTVPSPKSFAFDPDQRKSTRDDIKKILRTDLISRNSEFREKVPVAVAHEELTIEERNLLSVAYKNVIDARCASWRIISSIEQKEKHRGNKDHVSTICDNHSTIETELSSIRDGIFKLLDSHLIPSASFRESKAFYLKMKGDYHRYLAELTIRFERKDIAESTLPTYNSIQDIVNTELPPTHLMGLGLALNLSVFSCEILNSSYRACNLAKQAFDDQAFYGWPTNIINMAALKAAGANWIQFVEPTLVKDFDAHQLQAFVHAYAEMESSLYSLNILLGTYVTDVIAEACRALTSLKGVTAYRFDLVRGERTLNLFKDIGGIVDRDKLVVSTSYSLLHTVVDHVIETKLDAEIKS